MPSTRHVLPNPKGGWDNRKYHATRASTHHQTQKEAIETARQMSKREGSELKIHGSDYQIRASNSYGNDPRKIRG